MTAFLTKHQRKAMLFIEELERTGGIAPSVREIAFHYRSTSTAIIKREPPCHQIAADLLRLEN